MIYESELQVAIDCVKKAASVIVHGNEKVLNNDGRDIKLVNKKNSEKIIIENLKSSFPYSILSEEFGCIGGTNENESYWIIDPLDGTLNFHRNFHQACISIALWQNDEPILISK